MELVILWFFLTLFFASLIAICIVKQGHYDGCTTQTTHEHNLDLTVG